MSSSCANQLPHSRCLSAGFDIMALFTWLIICLFQLVFSTKTVFFSHNKLANNIFQPTYEHSRTGPMSNTPRAVLSSCASLSIRVGIESAIGSHLAQNNRVQAQNKAITVRAKC
jgi:hypothetical protein